jgi:hypothetical protein
MTSGIGSTLFANTNGSEFGAGKEALHLKYSLQFDQI